MAAVIRSTILRALVCSVIIASLMVAPCISVEQESLVKRQTSSFGKGRFLRADGKKVYFSGVELADSIFTYQPERSKESRSVSASQVIRIEVERGSYALEYGLLCGLSCLIFTSLAVASSESEASELGVEADSDLGASLVVGFTVAGGLIGALIGSSRKKYTVVYPNP